ncbi:MAG TPA: alpha/beta fold hydrolase [Acidimicrobiia bacterium]|nr:alpha/beta fold hydrolase [Acidimicrobiia bacterium]
MPTVNVNGLDVYFERRGHGPRLLFLNGSGTTLARTRPMLDPFTERFDTVAHDQRGLGETEIPPGPYRMADYAADAAALLDHLGWDRCRVVGVSFGGMVAQELAVTWPARVERLALCCTSPGGPGRASYPLEELADVDGAEYATAFPPLLDTRFTPSWLEAHPDTRAFVEVLAQRPARPSGGEVRRGEREQLLARRGHDVWDRLPAITCPTLVASGRYDGIAPASNGEAIASQVPGAVFRAYEGGHLFFVQDRAAVPDVLDFLAADA